MCATLSRRESAQEVVDADSLMREQEVVEVRTISFIRVHSYERSAHSHFPCHLFPNKSIRCLIFYLIIFHFLNANLSTCFPIHIPSIFSILCLLSSILFPLPLQFFNI